MPKPLRALLPVLPAALALSLTLPLSADAQIKEARRVSNYVTATCKSWVNSVSATVVCQDIAYDGLPAGTCLSRSCGSDSGGVAKFADGRYEGAFDGAYPGKGYGRLERTDGSVIEGNFRRGEMWEVTAYFPDGVMWKGTVASELKQIAFGTWSAYRDQGGTRYSGVIRYGSLFARPEPTLVAEGRARLNKEPGAKPAPQAPGTDLTPVVARSKGLTAVTTGEHATCWGLYTVMAQSIPNFGRMGLPEAFSPEAVAVRAKAWEKMTKAVFKKNGRADWEADKAEAVTRFRKAYDVGQLDLIADYAGVCIADPRPE